MVRVAEKIEALIGAGRGRVSSLRATAAVKQYFFICLPNPQVKVLSFSVLVLPRCKFSHSLLLLAFYFNSGILGKPFIDCRLRPQSQNFSWIPEIYLIITSGSLI
jgi:hypothetical protein